MATLKSTAAKTSFPLACLPVIFAFLFFQPARLVSQKHLFILERGTHQITSLALDGSGAMPVKEIGQGLLNPYDLILDEDAKNLYWTDGTNNAIIQSQAKDLSSQVHSPYQVSVAVDLEIDRTGQKIYWVDNIAHQIVRANLDGSGQESIPTANLPNPSALTLVPALDLLFYSDIDSQQIWSGSLSGDKRFVVAKGVGFPVRLIADPVQSKIYWASDGEHLIERSNFDGSAREVFYQGQEVEYPFGLYLDQEKRFLYWSDYGNGSVKRGRIDKPFETETILTGLSDPVAIVILDKSFFKQDKSTDRESSSDRPPRLMLFPNPANRTIWFSSFHKDQIIEWLRVLDSTGREIYYHNISLDTYALDIHDFTEGYYNYIAQINGHLLSGHFSVIH